MNTIERIEARFRSGNSVPVERASITTAEWRILRDALHLSEDLYNALFLNGVSAGSRLGREYIENLGAALSKLEN